MSYQCRRCRTRFYTKSSAQSHRCGTSDDSSPNFSDTFDSIFSGGPSGGDSDYSGGGGNFGGGGSSGSWDGGSDSGGSDSGGSSGSSD